MDAPVPSPPNPAQSQVLHTRRCTPMLRKFLCSASFAGLLLSGIALHARPAQQQQPPPKQRTEQTKTAQGKVTDIASDKKSFTIEVNDGSSKHTMQFVLEIGRAHV